MDTTLSCAASSSCATCLRCSAYCPRCRSPSASALRPHIVLILADDVGWNNVAWTNSRVRQPHLLSLAQGGIVLNSLYATPACAPSRAALMTGRYSWRTASSRCNLLPASAPDGVDLGLTFLPRHLAAAGYYCIHSGKWHNGFAAAAYTPVGRGFHESLARLEGGGDHWTHASNAADLRCDAAGGPIGGVDHWSSSGDANWDLWEASNATFPGGPVRSLVGLHGNESVYSGVLFTSRAVSRILSRSYSPEVTPLFLFLSLEEAHVPIDPPQRFEALYDDDAVVSADAARKRYYGALSILDESAANVTAALHARGMWNKTLLIWLSDNGAVTHRKGGSNHPLRGAKHSLWEGALRVPGFVAGGAVPKARRGSTLDGLVDLVDIYATLSDVAGLGPSAPDGTVPSDSMSMWPYLSGVASASPRHEIIHWFAEGALGVPTFHGDADGWRCSRVNRTSSEDSTDGAYWKLRGAVRSGPYKLLLGDNPWASWYGEHSPNASSPPKSSPLWSDAVAKCGDVGCLYDIEQDPTERIDLASWFPAIADELRAKLLSLDPVNPANGQLPYASQAPVDEGALKFCAVVQSSGGFVGPWLD